MYVGTSGQSLFPKSALGEPRQHSETVTRNSEDLVAAGPGEYAESLQNRKPS